MTTRSALKGQVAVVAGGKGAGGYPLRQAYAPLSTDCHPGRER
jgi:Na+/citrate or Na+/malate symporter